MATEEQISRIDAIINASYIDTGLIPSQDDFKQMMFAEFGTDASVELQEKWESMRQNHAGDEGKTIENPTISIKREDSYTGEKENKLSKDKFADSGDESDGYVSDDRNDSYNDDTRSRSRTKSRHFDDDDDDDDEYVQPSAQNYDFSDQVFTPNIIYDGNIPKKPVTCFFLFSSNLRPQVKANNPNVGEKEISKLLGDQWKSLSERDQALWKKRADVNMMEYKNVLEKLRETDPELYQKATAKKEKKKKDKVKKEPSDKKPRQSRKLKYDPDLDLDADELDGLDALSLDHSAGRGKRRRALVPSEDDDNTASSKYDKHATYTNAELLNLVLDEPYIDPVEEAEKLAQMSAADQIDYKLKKEGKMKRPPNPNDIHYRYKAAHESHNLINKMMEKAQQDEECIKRGVPALHKLGFINAVSEKLNNVHYHQVLIEFGVLKAVARWLTIHNNMLILTKVREELYTLLGKLNIDDEQHIIESGIGKVILQCWLHPKETAANKRTLHELIQKWSRLVINVSTSYSHAVTNSNFRADANERRMLYDETRIANSAYPARFQAPPIDFSVLPAGVVSVAHDDSMAIEDDENGPKKTKKKTNTSNLLMDSLKKLNKKSVMMNPGPDINAHKF